MSSSDFFFCKSSWINSLTWLSDFRWLQLCDKRNFMHHGKSRDYIVNDHCMLTVWRIIALEVEGKISCSCLIWWRVKTLPGCGLNSSHGRRESNSNLSFYYTERRQEWLLLTSLQSSLCIFKLLILHKAFSYTFKLQWFSFWFCCIIYLRLHYRFSTYLCYSMYHY